MDMNKVKDKIRKLLAIANDSSEVDGEIRAAMKLAQDAMDKYHLDLADIECSAGDSGVAAKVVEMNREQAFGKNSRMSSWESALGLSVSELIGSVDVYVSWTLGGTFGTEKRKCLQFYGAADDVRLAIELYAEWQLVIAAMATGRFGRAYKGDGLQYCDGFVSSLYEQVKAAARERKPMVTESTTAIVHVAGGSLADVLASKRDNANRWLLDTHGVKLSRGRGRGGSRRTGGLDAYHTGRADGRRAEFTARRIAKLTG